jgi:hypothetical protein
MTRGLGVYNIEGRLAARAGAGIESNPYPAEEALKWNGWNAGWNWWNNRTQEKEAARKFGSLDPICRNCAYFNSKTSAWGWCSHKENDHNDQPERIKGNNFDWSRLSKKATCDKFELSGIRVLEAKNGG